MLFTSLVFLFLFLPFTLLGFLLILPRLRKPLLLIASLVFCAWGGVSYVAILIAIILFNYLFGILLDAAPSPKTRSSWLITGLLVNVLALLAFKYTPFFETNFNILVSVFRLNPVHVRQIILPLGISIFTLRGISYLVTVYRQEAPAQRNFTELGLYIGFFP
ncbi:MAG: MBOAT family protein, partial [Bacteroidetes bacterium]|nr:MBOAT family protein [Bacteroidota bacterium]